MVSCKNDESPDESLWSSLGEEFDFKEMDLLRKIDSAKSLEERERLIAELEATSERLCPFYSRWLSIHDISPFHCWTDSGYDSSLSEIPRDIQLLAATGYGLSEILNGGLIQFFSSGTGDFAPEMIEWFYRSGMAEGAAHMEEATRIFGANFPHSSIKRREILEKFSGEKRADWDPFYKLDEFFGDAVFGPDTDDDMPDKYIERANKWLRDTCGIRNLRTSFESKKKEDD